MKLSWLSTSTIIAAMLVVAGCQDPEVAEESTVASYADFREAFEAGADCPELYEVRNRMESDDPLVEDANEDLRSVECYSNSSTRSAD